MSRIAVALLTVVGTLAGLGVVGLLYVRETSLSARMEPGVLETRVARAVRSIAVPADVREQPNPVPASLDDLAEARVHYADHCAVCHGDDGSGDTAMGRGLWPKAPDMRRGPTQELTDGELFWIIENGIRFTGMPGWGTGTPDGEKASWQLVRFIRHLPDLSETELEEIGMLLPRSEADIRQEIEEERFLRGED